jgi:translocation and assembly module TamB
LRRLLTYLLAGLLLLVAMPLIAQDQMSEAEQRDWLVQFVEDQLSTPERQIRLSNIEGLLSERASIREITISDAEGVWLRVVNAVLDWNQGALFTGRLEVRSLSAELIEVIRNPVPSDAVDIPAPEAGGLAVPELPVAVILQQLSVPKVTFGQSVFGLGSEISVTGSLVLEGGNLDADLDVTRLDGPGGKLVADVVYRREGQTIDLGVTLTEPEDGILANLLNIAERPPIALAVKGSGPVADLRTEMTLDAGDLRALSGVATIAQAPEGFRVAADLRGPIAELVEPLYRPFFGAETALSATALVRQEGGVSISGLKLSGGQLSVGGMAETTKDGFLRLLDLSVVIADPAGTEVTLPLPGEPTTVNSAQLTIGYGSDEGGGWSGTLAVDGLEAGEIAASAVTLNASGVAVNLDDPATRRVTFNGDGAVTGIVTESPEVQAALGDSIGLGIAGLWNAGDPLQLAELRLEGKALSLALAGELRDLVFDGGVAIEASSVAPFSGVAGRRLAGALDLRAEGTVSPLIGGFDLTLAGTGTDLRLGEDALDAVLKGDVALSGRVARTEAGIEAQDFRIANERLTLAADGRIASTAADFDFRLELDDLALLSREASGALTVIGRAEGTDGPITVDLTASVPQGSLVDRPLRDAALRLAGTLNEGAFDGSIGGSASLDGQPVSLTAGLASNDQQKRLSDLIFEAAGARVTGEVAQAADGALSGAVEVNAPDISTAAALALLDATGSIRGTAQIGGTADAPRGTFAVSGSGINAAEIRPYGIAPLRFDARGSLADNAMRLETLSATGAGGLRLAANGAIPLSGGGMALDITGSAPLALGNQFVADRGGQLSGTANLEARVTGALSDPQFSGRVSTSGAGYIDPELGLRLQGITGSARLAGERIAIENLTAALATGGSLAVSGSIGLDAPNTADLTLRLNSARYADSDLLVATVSGNLALAGPLARNPTLSGDIFVEEANILVPESFGGATALIEVEHVRPAPAVQATLARARLNESGAPATRASDLQLDINLRAPNRIFIRGRGLDAEMGGAVRLTGSLSNIHPVGGFSLNRGRLAILGQRVTFESGTVTLMGDLDPFFNLVARTDGDGITVFVTVSGRASEPQISFSSNPALPEDEVLSRLIFNRSMGELSPLQLAKLAGAAAELAGGGGTSLTESLRGAAGLADLDIVTDERGNLAVQAGHYVQENIYLGVQAGADGESRVTVNLDLTDEIKAKASAGADGNSSVGVFYETDY